jgi:hypothetical protein
MMKPGTLVTSRERVYLDPPDMLVGEDGESSWSEILALDYKDIPFGPDEVGLVISVRMTKLTNRTLWVKVLTPNGVGVCFADELEEVPLY